MWHHRDVKQLQHYVWLCREIEDALALSGTQETAEEVAAYKARLRELIGRSLAHLQDSVARMRAIEAGLD